MAEAPIDKYGCQWPPGTDPLKIEFACIRHGGRWEHKDKPCGLGLFHHYREAQSLLWPKSDHHRWSDLILKTILDERITVVVGCRDSSKTHTIVKYALTDYFALSQNTLIIMSSTSLQGADLRVFGQVKRLWLQARKIYPWLPGNCVDAEKAIYTDALDSAGDVRDKTKGFVCIAAEESEATEFAGLQRFIGVKQERRRLLGNELQFIGENYVKALANLDEGDFKGVFDGNPLGQKALDKISEPEAGWETLPEPQKTTCWRNKFSGVTINLVGTDSPNFDKDRPKKYPYLISQESVDRVGKAFGFDSAMFYSQIKGVRMSGMNAHLVLTADLCQRHGAFDPCVWGHEKVTKVYAIDAGFGGDACESMILEFGSTASGQNVIKLNPTQEIPIIPSATESPEDQIATRAKITCDAEGIPPENVFIEAGMRATLATSFARIMSSGVNFVLAGGPATDRAVSKDLYVSDEKTGERRQKRWNEHVSKFITELWYCVRELVESKQLRELPADVLKEFASREWIWAAGMRYELETKQDFKRRHGYSPNKADCASIGVEGCRRLGFIIERMKDPGAESKDPDWLEKELREQREQRKKNSLTYA